MLASIDEIAHVLAARADRGAQHLKDAEKMLLKLFSAGSRDHITRMNAGGVTRVVPNPALNLMGFAVPDKLGEALTDGDVASGLLNRMLIAVGDGSPWACTSVLVRKITCGAVEVNVRLRFSRSRRWWRSRKPCPQPINHFEA